MQPSPAAVTLWGFVATVVGMVATTIGVLVLLLRWPMAGLRDTLVFRALEQNPDRWRAAAQRVFAERWAESERHAAQLSTLDGALGTLRAAAEAQAKTLESLPPMERTLHELALSVQGLSDAVREFRGEVRAHGDDLKLHGQDLAHMRGRLDEWDGVSDRRTRERRRSP